LGKSTIALDIAARLSAGRKFTNDFATVEPGVSLLLSAEAGISDTILPRLEAADADLDRIHVLQSVPDLGGTERPVVIPNDIHLIEAVIDKIGAELVVIDPFMAFLSGDVNSHALDRNVSVA
jgi:RecA-family ATPase